MENRWRIQNRSWRKQGVRHSRAKRKGVAPNFNQIGINSEYRRTEERLPHYRARDLVVLERRTNSPGPLESYNQFWKVFEAEEVNKPTRPCFQRTEIERIEKIVAARQINPAIFLRMGLHDDLCFQVGVPACWCTHVDLLTLVPDNLAGGGNSSYTRRYPPVIFLLVPGFGDRDAPGRVSIGCAPAGFLLSIVT